MAREYAVGHRVMLILTGVRGISGDLKKYNNECFNVSKIKHITNTRTCQTHTYYELAGCVSPKGVPYAIEPEWLYDIGAWI
jgi:hypothetical protein